MISTKSTSSELLRQTLGTRASRFEFDVSCPNHAVSAWGIICLGGTTYDKREIIAQPIGSGRVSECLTARAGIGGACQARRDGPGGPRVEVTERDVELFE